MKKSTGIILGVLVVLAFVLYYFLSGSGGQNQAVVAGTTPGGTTATAEATTTSQTSTTTAGGVPPQAAQYKDGTYTGPVTDAVYGKLQVVVTIANGKIVDTNCPVQPSDGGHTQQVSATALPQLRQEAIASQSANVNIVSGATQTSEAYQQSLAAALAMAKN